LVILLLNKIGSVDDWILSDVNDAHVNFHSDPSTINIFIKILYILETPHMSETLHTPETPQRSFFNTFVSFLQSFWKLFSKSNEVSLLII
jgi:hypothetical protein